MKVLKYKFSNWQNPYDQIDMDTPFAKAVNEMVGQYWADTGRQMPLEDAIYSVLADMFDRLAPPV